MSEDHVIHHDIETLYNFRKHLDLVAEILIKGELCVQDIADSLQMTQSAISHQLRVLKQAHLVKSRRDGKTIYYSLADDHVMTIMAQGLEHVWCE